MAVDPHRGDERFAAASADGNLLFGILALQMDFVTRDQLVAAMNAWVLDKAKTLGDILSGQNALDDDTLALLEALVRKHLVMHHNDAGKSLVALSSLGSAKNDLKQIADADVQASVGILASARADDADDPYATRPQPTVGAPTSTGLRFRILRPHAEGGLGKVYVADDGELHREVALKEIKDRFADHAESRARFVVEAEITGGLEHPGIVPVYGLGTYADGRPFYAMRFIRGDSLQEAIKQFHASGSLKFDSLEFRQLLGRFVDVCQAIAYAHSRKVLHRDLKPGNIMLGRYGETLVVDWGLAKAMKGAGPTSAALKDELPLTPASGSGTGETLPGEAIGTPEFMSPEQAAGRLDLIGPATDIYSLGATLYTVLTGRSPVNGANVAEVLRKVERGEYQSARYVNAKVPPALAAVCAKAMALKPADRYGSALDLAADVEHWLADEPVTAWREPVSARAWRWVRQHRTAVTTAAALVAASAVGLGILAAEKERAREAVSDEQTKTAEALVHAEEARKTAVAISDFYVGMFQSPDPRKDGRTITVAETLDTATKKLENDLTTPPVERVRLMYTLAGTYRRLSLPRQSIPLYEKARDYFKSTAGPEDNDTLNSMEELAISYSDAGRRDEALKLREEVLAVRRRVSGPEKSETLRAMVNLASSYLDAGRRDDAIKLQSDALALYRTVRGPEHSQTLTAINNLAQSYAAAGRLAEAIKLQEELLTLRRKLLGPENLDTIGSMYNLAGSYAVVGRAVEALKMEEEVLSRFRTLLGPEHDDTLVAMQGVATLYDTVLRRDDALKMREEVLALRRKASGPEHPATLWAMNNLAASYLTAGRRDEAMKLQEEVLTLRRKVSGPENPATLTAMNNLSVSYSEAGRRDDALKLRTELLPLSRKMNGPEHPQTLQAMVGLAASYREAGKFEQAASLLEEGLPVARKQLPHDSALMGVILGEFGWSRLKIEAFAEAEPPLREGLAIFEKLIPDGLAPITCRSDLGAALLGLKKFAEAEPLLLASFNAMKKREKTIPPGRRYRLPEVVDRLIELYTATNKPDEVKNWREERAKYADAVP